MHALYPGALAVGTDRAGVVTGHVVVVNEMSISVRVADEPTRLIECQVLVTSGRHPCLAVGDVVLVWLPPVSDQDAVILGRVGPPRASALEDEERADVPATLLLEATESLTLRVGDGSIEIRADGKILIKGTDLVSHAKRMNRIKGGAVSIN